MTVTQLEAKMREVIADQLGLGEDEIKLESNFVEDLGADSLDIVEIVMAFEEDFDVEIDATKILTFGEALEYLKKKCPHLET